MKKREKDGIEWLEFELFQPYAHELSHAIFLRKGGVSFAPFDSLNFSFSNGDDPDAVEENRQRAQRILKCGALKTGHLIHGADLLEATSASQTVVGLCDGLISKEKGVGLMVTHADCQAALFYDPVEKAIASVHCGWRGNVKNIYLETVKKLQADYGCKPENLIVGISPSLGPDSAQFINYLSELPQSFWGFQVKPLYFDLWAISKAQLIEAGVLPDQIEIANLCTFENAQDFFSYRRQGARSGRNATAITLL